MPNEPERGFVEGAQHDTSWGPEAFHLARALSEGDRSVLLAALMEIDKGDESPTLLTSRGSPNDFLWAHMSRVGMTYVDPDATPGPLAEVCIGYKINADHIAALRHLVPALLAPRS